MVIDVPQVDITSTKKKGWKTWYHAIFITYWSLGQGVYEILKTEFVINQTEQTKD
mgnify:CR=1 FL=1